MITRAQSTFIQTDDRTRAFDGLLQRHPRLTGCEYGFVGEVLHRPNGAPYLKTHAVTNIAWNDETRALYEKHKDEGLEFDNPNTLFGRTLTTRRGPDVQRPLRTTRAAARCQAGTRR